MKNKISQILPVAFKIAGLPLDSSFVIKHVLCEARKSFRKRNTEPFTVAEFKNRLEMLILLLTFLLSGLPEDEFVRPDWHTLESLIKVAKHSAQELFPGAGDELGRLLVHLRAQRNPISSSAPSVTTVLALRNALDTVRENNGEDLDALFHDQPELP